MSTDEQIVIETQGSQVFPSRVPKDFCGTFSDLARMMTAQESQRAAKREYVLGFCFLQFCNDVVLIRKNRPEWQKGLLNGVGGKIEPDESPLDAMRREWEEETGTLIQDWQHFVTMSFSGAVVYVFKCATERWLNINTVTDEPVGVYSVEDVLHDPTGVIPNLKWLIPMALYDSQTDQSHWKGAPILNYP